MSIMEVSATLDISSVHENRMELEDENSQNVAEETDGSGESVAAAHGESVGLVSKENNQKELSNTVRKMLHTVQTTYHEDLVELNFIQSGSLLINFHGWRQRTSQEMMQALCSGHLDPEDLALIGDFISGHVAVEKFFPSTGLSGGEQQLAGVDADSDEEGSRLDELSIYRLASEELDILKRVNDLKRTGLWSGEDDLVTEVGETGSVDQMPSFSSLVSSAPERSERVYTDYLFAELRWLAEDFKRERNWKKISAKKLAIAGVKAYREKTERSIRAEKEEVVRIRKFCATVAKMVREWWRQIDKIVHAKQQARLTVKRQQAITTHLGRVLETTEEYTRWLTEGIAGEKTTPTGGSVDATMSDSTSDGPDSGLTMTNKYAKTDDSRKKKPRRDSACNSDVEFTADEETLAAEEDDEETIEREEQEEKALALSINTLPSADVEIAQLAAEATCPIEDLLPPGYFDAVHKEPSQSDEENREEEEQDSSDPDRSFKAESDNMQADDENNNNDDETTIEAQERHEEAQRKTEVSANPDGSSSTSTKQTVEDELAQLELEATMPLDQLLSQLVSQDDAQDEDGVDAASQSNISSSTRVVDTSSSSGEESDIDEDESTEEKEDESTSSDAESEDVPLKHLLTDIDKPEEVQLKNMPTEDDACSKKELISNDESLTCVARPEEQENLKALTADALQIQPHGTSQSTNESNVTSPYLLSGGTLREYQLVGLNWLAAIYQKRLNGILADEMGLGKTIQTIALLAHLACEHGIWGPHLIVVPTSVILNWEIEFKRWCPGFKIITYYGHIKERRERRRGWTKTNAFHVCITSYRLAIQDASVFKRKRWKYLILDEAQNIKNFKSQRWQTLLTFNSQRRLLLTGTPLQNSLMELWSLMHFLMPHIFQSHRDFQEWFASPLTGMIEGTSERNDELVARLHKVLRPFLLRRLKADVERQMPKKYEHVVMCRLSRRQRFLYDDFMSTNNTRETLKSGQFLSVMNVLMQLRKVCNHPNLFETRPIISPFHVDEHLLRLSIPRLIATHCHPYLVLAPQPHSAPSNTATASAFVEPDLDWLDPAGVVARLLGQVHNVAEMARDLPTFAARRCRELCAPVNLISVVDTTAVSDDVTGRRESLERGKIDGSAPVPFFSRTAIRVVNESLSYRSGYYPALPRARPVDPAIVETPAPARPCNLGMPKSILRNRALQRQHTLQRIARINQHRCHLWSNSETGATGAVKRSRIDADYGSPIGPDVVHLITRMLREPSKSTQTPLHGYPGLYDGWAGVQRSLHTCPTRPDRSNFQSIRAIDEAGCLPVTRPWQQSVANRLGPEASWHDTGCRLTRSTELFRGAKQTLRGLLTSPTDLITDLKEVLTRFAFATPAVISGGFTVHTSCHKYQTQVGTQSTRIYEFLVQQQVLPPVCRSSVIRTVGKKSSPGSAPLSPLAWLAPVQLHRVTAACRIQFPDPRLIQYDCGKLQRLDLLLRELKSGSHRVLIFTQMARMLDILEQFLAFHGHRYVRLDGTTKVEQRQLLMERFNQDTQIFAFILSTRSGGLGVNLTGADTVVFYDSDWNPTMDAQAQDRCHRIGQTRDVHIYRLISERTVEENILRKANQKRLLADVAIEGGRFTTAFFKQNTITELFAEPKGLQDLVADKEKRNESFNPTDPSDPLSTQPSITTATITTRSGRQVKPPRDAVASVTAPTYTAKEERELVALLEACEEENDRIAAERAMAEAKAELAEFDENIPFSEAQRAAATATGALSTTISNEFTDSQAGNDASTAVSITAPQNEPDPIVQFAMAKHRHDRVPAEEVTCPTAEIEESVALPLTVEEAVEKELVEFETSLRPIERFGVRQLELVTEVALHGELEMADAQLSESKETWRLDQLKALHVADEERAAVEEDDMLYCYGAYDPSAQQRAELARLERIIAAEEEEDQVTGPSSRARGRQSRVGPASGSKIPLRRPQGIRSTTSDLDSASNTGPDDGTTTDSQRAGADGRLNYAASSDSDYETLRFEPNTKRVTITRQPVYSNKNCIDQWESVDDNYSDRAWSHTGSTSSSLARGSRIMSKTNSGKRRRRGGGGGGGGPLSSSNTSPHAKAAKFHSMSSSALDYTKSTTPTSRQQRHALDMVVPGAFVRTHGGVASQHVSPDCPTHVVHEEEVIGQVMPPHSPNLFASFRPRLHPDGRLVSLPNQSPTRPMQQLVTRAPSTSRNIHGFFDRSNPPVQHLNSPYNVHVTKIAPVPPSETPPPRQPTASAVLAATRGRGFPIPYSPSAMPLATSIVTPVATRPLVSTPPLTTTMLQHPAEPTIPVQSVLNGTRTNLPAGQLFTPTGQPVFVITRQMKTPTGEVFQQRFTHPVVPPQQFTQVVHQLNRHLPIVPNRSPTPAFARPVFTSVRPTLQSVSTLNPTTTAVHQPRPILRLSSPTTPTRHATQSYTPIAVRVVNPLSVSARPPSTMTSMTGQPSVVPVVRMLTAVEARTTPFFRLLQPASGPRKTGAPIITMVNTSPHASNQSAGGGGGGNG